MAAFDPVAFAMGKAGASRDLVSALMGGSGGGGGSGTLEESGWVKELVGTAAVSGNNISMPSGASTTRCYVQPTEELHPSRWFVDGDELVLAVKVNSTNGRCRISCDDNSKAVGASATGLFTFDVGKARGYATQPGTDVLTWTFSGTMKTFFFQPTNSSGSAVAAADADIDITGMKFNGNIIFGKV